MKHIVVFYFVFVFAILFATAQSGDTILHYQASFDVNNVKKTLDDIKYRKNGTDVYRPSSKAVDSVWLVDNILYVKCINERDVFDKVLNKLKQSIEVNPSQSQSTVVDIQETPFENLTAEDFLKLRDTTIFTDNFVLFHKDSVQPYAKNYYCLIELIHRLFTEMNEYERIPHVQRQKIKQLLDSMNDIVIKIGSDYKLEKNYLSPVQQEYYLKLYNKFNQRWEEEYGSETEE